MRKNCNLDKARELLQSYRHFVLNAEEWQQFTATLENPPEPNEALQTAWRDYIGISPYLDDEDVETLP